MMEFINFNKKNLGILFFILSLLLFGLMIVTALTKPFIDNDCYYTIGIVQFPFMEMINATAANVHPPLYYVILKICLGIFDIFNIHNLVLIGKFVSLLAIGLLLLFNIFKVRKDFGLLIAGIFSFLITASTNVMLYSNMIRMYTWGLLFVTILLVFLYDIIRESSDRKAWIFFTLASICCIYTHYFAAFDAVFVYLLLFLYLMRNNKNELKKFFISSLICIVSFLPWIGIVYNQFFSTVYKPNPITLGVISNSINFIFSPGNNLFAHILGILLILSLVYLLYMNFINKNMDEALWKFSLISLSIIFLSFLFGVAFSILIRPIFMARYLLPAFGGLWLAFSIFLAKSFDNKKVFYLITILILIVSIAGSLSFISESDSYYTATLNHIEFFDSINDGRTVVFDAKLSDLRYSPYLYKDNCIYDKEMKDLDKYYGNDTVIFIKMGFDKINGTDYEFKKIYGIYQDDVYVFD